MSTSRNFFSIFVLSIIYIICSVMFAPYDWFYQAILPTFIAVMGFYLSQGPVLVRSVVSGMAPLVSLPVLSVFFQNNFNTIILMSVIHAVLIGAFLGLMWGNVDAYLRGKRTPKI